jgi:quinol-cytochrome oxidoreductase complex cytochrome b subunit
MLDDLLSGVAGYAAAGEGKSSAKRIWGIAVGIGVLFFLVMMVQDVFAGRSISAYDAMLTAGYSVVIAVLMAVIMFIGKFLVKRGVKP